ncbi:YeeE/YedE family protein [Arvimicrobium flavum]|uniref:YeeE/YedE family protein n=1 Tax=Arvimicrobium flavum TaxID=3393320 RepID=UPI00237B3C53|nr:YeeE/YedE family protein [Mesorhizobium shangrilense]
MPRILSALVAGLIFGAGIAVSGMINPAKVLNFFDIAETWDPSLAFVMGGALAVTALGYFLVLKRPTPAFEKRFHLPTKKRLDLPLIGGSALFGIGWGIAGFCPGGSIPALGLGQSSAFVFVAAMIAGMFAVKLVRSAMLVRAVRGRA